MGLKSAWLQRIPAQDLSSLSPEEQDTLIALAQADGGGRSGYLDALPQKRATRENFSKSGSETKKVELEKELGPEILSNPAFSAIRERAEGLPLLALQGRGVDSLEGALSELKSEPQRVDYRPLLGAVASLGGPDLSKFYEAPPSPLERKQLEIKLQDLIQRRRESEAMTQLKAMFGQKIPQQVVATSGTTQTAGGEKGDKTVFLTQTPMGTAKGMGKPKLGNILKEDQYRKAEAIANLNDQLREYVDTFKKYGYSPVGEHRALLEQKASSLMSVMGVADAMGALQKHEVDMLKKRLGGATGFIGPIKGTLFRGGAKGEAKALDDLQNTFSMKGKTFINSLKKDPVYSNPAYADQIRDLETRINSGARATVPPGSKPANQMTKEEILKELESYGVKR